mgnify:CR=1 FL=1
MKENEIILKLLADTIQYINKRTLLIIYELLTEELRNSYHTLEYLFIKNIDTKLARVVINKNNSVLNVGCGLPINEIIFRSWGVKKVVGIDIDKEVIEKGKSWLQKLNIDNVELHVGDALNIDYPDNSFDVVVSFSAIEHVQGWKNYEKWIKEMSRVAKKYIVLTTSNRKNWIIYVLSKLFPHSYYEYFFTPEQIERLLLKHNLKIVHFETNTLMCNEYIPLPDKFKYNILTLRLNIFLDQMREKFLKNYGGRMGFIGVKNFRTKASV